MTKLLFNITLIQYERIFNAKLYQTVIRQIIK